MRGAYGKAMLLASQDVRDWKFILEDTREILNDGDLIKLLAVCKSSLGSSLDVLILRFKLRLTLVTSLDSTWICLDLLGLRTTFHRWSSVHLANSGMYSWREIRSDGPSRENIFDGLAMLELNYERS